MKRLEDPCLLQAGKSEDGRRLPDCVSRQGSQKLIEDG